MHTLSPAIQHVTQTIIVDPKQAPSRIDKFLISKLASITRTNLQNNLKQGHILVNAKQVKPSYTIRAKDIITLCIPTRYGHTAMVAENIPLHIVYEDKDVLVVNKPAGMVVHPACDNWQGTLVNALLYHYKELPFEAGNEGRPGLVHRIDKGTSGLLVIAKTKEGLISLSKQFIAHTIERKYLALVWGRVAADSGTLSLPLIRDPKDRRLIKACAPSSSVGKNATTHYQVIQRWEYVTLLTCTLETGRTHQIRAHMKYLGHPLFGDPRYGGNEILHGTLFARYRSFVDNCFKILPHQALHAQTLGFTHPTTQKKMHFQTSPPQAFEQVLNRWKRYIEGKNN